MTHSRRILSLETEDLRLTADLDDSRGVEVFWSEVTALMRSDSGVELPEEGLLYLIRVKAEEPVVMAISETTAI